MSGATYEGYTEALRRGHVAALRGRLDVALAAYRDAARIAPDRALPYVGLGGVMARLGRVDDALAAYRTALDRAPDDEGALRGRADLLAGEGRRAEAASTLDRLAGVLERSGRTADACDIARRALELAESRGRRKLVQALVEQLRATAGDPRVVEALERALGVLEVASEGAILSNDAPPESSAPATEPTGATNLVASEPAPTPSGTTVAEGDGTDRGAPPDLAPRRVPPADPLVLGLAFEAALDGGNLDEARKQAVAGSAAHRANGQFHAAIDSCYRALAIAPADPAIHFALVQLYLDRGWRNLAADKLVLIGRLTELTGDSANRARLCDLVTRRFPDEARLAAFCA